MLMPDFKAAKGKKRTWGTYDGKYCLYIENKRILPPVGADYVQTNFEKIMCCVLLVTKIPT